MKCVIQPATVVFALASLLVMPLSSSGQTTFYSQRTGFVAASGSLSTIGFENLAPADGFVNYGLAGSYSEQGVTFSVAGDEQLFVNSATYYTTTYTLGNGDYLVTGPPVGISAVALMTITLPANVTALGFDLGTFDFPSSAISITLANGEQRLLSAPYPSAAFYGVTTSSPIASLSLRITIGDRKDVLALDTFQFGRSKAAVPAPSALFPMIMGSVILFGAMKIRGSR